MLIHFNLQKTSKNSLNKEEIISTREYPAELPGPEYKMELVWRNIIIFAFLHIGAVYGYFTPKRSWWTVVFSKLITSSNLDATINANNFPNSIKHLLNKNTFHSFIKFKARAQS
jgi:hypothetical protein